MNFLDNMVKSSNALIKDRLNNPFGAKQQPPQDQQANEQQSQQPTTSGDCSELEKQQTSGETRGSTASAGGTLKIDSGDDGDKNSRFAAIAADAEAVTQNAVKGAKNIGTFLFSMANKAGQTVSQTAKQVKQAVESTNILTDFTKEQQEFIKEHGGILQAGELPWENCLDDPDKSKAMNIREQILSLSQDKRNFVRSPPNDADFQFDPQQYYPTALSLLKEDPNLGKMRFELVPKLVNEDTFWRNYFYRVSLLKQMSDRGDDVKRSGWASSRSSSGEGPDEFSIVNDDTNQSIDDSSPNYATNIQTVGPSAKQSNFDTAIIETPATNTTVTSTTNTNVVADSAAIPEPESSESRKLFAEADDLKSKLRELNIGSLDGGDQDENDKWEEELQKDLQEFELVSGDVSALDEESLDEEIMELKESAKGNAK